MLEPIRLKKENIGTVYKIQHNKWFNIKRRVRQKSHYFSERA